MAAEEFGKYQLIKRLAAGGMAQIYLARQKGPEGFEKLLVVKRILPHLAENEEFITMFLDEARIAARLNHPNVVQIFDLGAQDDSYFIAMEYIHGEDVRRVWKRAEASGQAVPLPLVCRVIIDACAGLDYAHRKADQNGKPLGIVHRDISPQNILVTFEGGVKVVDFGIAKAADQATVTRSGVLKGKYSYMSPEQAAGKKLDCRSDIFALGVVLYELLTRTRLFKRSNDIQTLNAVTECKVAPPSEVNPLLPADLDPVVMKALARSPDDRYQEAVHLQVALEDWLLQHQLPSSSVHVAAFMGEIYAERLAREAEEGRVLVEELDAARTRDEEGSPQKNKATPSLPSVSRATGKSARGSVASKPVARDVESTLADRPAGRSGPTRAKSLERALEKRALAAAAPEGDGETRFGATDVSRAPTRRSRALVYLASTAVIAITGLSYLLFIAPRASAAKAVVRIASAPAGATVLFNGLPVPQVTPCTLPPVAAGKFPLQLGKAGYLDYKTTVLVPESGEVDFPLITLEPDRPAIEPLPPERIDAGAPAARARVMLTVRSDPSGAALAVDGEPRGKTPATFQVEAGAALTLRLSHAGHKELERAFDVGHDPAQETTLTLERARRVEARPPDGSRDPRPVDHPKDPPVRGAGTVRFVVKPWAEVVCGSHALGQTPFKEKLLPAGEYDCKFTNPELGATLTRHIEVKANELSVVTVKFE